MRRVRTETVFCVDCDAVSPDSVIVKKERKTIVMKGKKVDGWVVVLETPVDEEKIPVDYTSGGERE